MLNKKNTLIWALILSSFIGFSQNFEKDKKSFSESYKYELEGKYSKAVTSLKTTYKEGSYEYNIRLGWLDYMAGQFIESISFYNKAISLKPMSIEARYGLINPLLAMGKVSKTRDTYLEILKISPLDTKANYRLALMYYQHENYKEAETLLLKVINIYPFDYDTIILLAWNSLQMGKTKEAQLLFQKALLFNPEDESALKGIEKLNWAY